MSETATTPVIDKSKWGEGPWQNEPDRVDFVHAGFACFVQRNNPALGNWCGYVGVPSGHPAYGKPFEDIDVEVHGGLTYADKCSGDICHVPAPGMPEDVWWLGFDCAHCYDLVPGMAARMRDIGISEYNQTYRTLSWVRAQTEQLAEQLAAHA